jgi:MoaA/NifB/PqqE/SkfB family radical SAM enzyme
MLSNNFISSDVCIQLYNWGEVFLHPNFKEIVKYLNSLQLSFSLSTNASKPVYFDNIDALKFLKFITFSMSGFSQKSYDRIHGFDFAKIRKNIIRITENFRQCGFAGRALISYHVYQFNLNEIKTAYEFAKSNNIIFRPYYAYFNEMNMSKKYLKNKLEYMELKSAGEELLLHGISKRLDEFNHIDKNNYSCPQFDMLTISEYCNVLMCCGVSDMCKNAVYKKIYDVNDIEEINIWRKNSKECKECLNIGLSYVSHNIVFWHEIFEQSPAINKIAIYDFYHRLENYDAVIIFGAGVMGKLIKKEILEYCKAIGKSLCFADNSHEKFKDGSVLSPKEAVSKFPNSLWIIGSDIHSQSMLENLRELNIEDSVTNMLLQ